MFLRAVGSLSFRTIWISSLALCAGCQVDPDGFTEQDRDFIGRMALSPIAPADSQDGNEYLVVAGVARLGQELFFDPDLSGNLVPGSHDGQPTKLFGADGGTLGRVSCADCHLPRAFFGDDRTSPNNVSLGLDFTARNSPSLVNVSFYRFYAWDGRSDSLWMQCATAYEAGKTMAGTRLRLARLIASRYGAEYTAAFGDGGFERLVKTPGVDGEFELGDGGAVVLDGGTNHYLNQISANGYKAMAAYITGLVSLDAGIDAFAHGDEAALSPAAKRGLHLFLGRAGCIECHLGPTFTDNSFHQIGLGQRGEHVPGTDDGRVTGQRLLVSGPQAVFNSVGEFSSTPKFDPKTLKADQGTPVFRTKSLRNVAMSPPYMHAGQLKTLQEVVAFYNSGGETVGFSGPKDPRIVPLGLSEAESADLVSFLEALTGAPIPPALTCDPAPRNDFNATAHRFEACK